jgi:DNA-binding beta-propeller fold protein YncE
MKATLIALALAAAAPSAFGGLFDKVADVPLGEKTSRFDYQSLDPSTGRLAVSKMGSGKLLVFDARSQTLVSELPGFPKTTGVLMVPELRKIYASVPGAGLSASLSVALGMAGMSKGSGAVAILDSASLKEIARLPAGVFPDGIAYDPRDKRIFVSDEMGGGLTVIGADDDKVIGRVDTGGEVGNVQYDPISRHVYVPVQSHDELIAVDPVALKVTARHKLPGCKHPHGLRIADMPSSSEAVGRENTAVGYVACDENDRLLAVDLTSGRITANLSIGHDADVLAADPGLKRLYVASESGILSVIDTSEAAKPVKLGDVQVGANAHSVAVDPTTHHIFLPLRDLNGKSVMRILVPK